MPSIVGYAEGMCGGPKASMNVLRLKSLNACNDPSDANWSRRVLPAVLPSQINAFFRLSALTGTCV